MASYVRDFARSTRSSASLCPNGKAKQMNAIKKCLLYLSKPYRLLIGNPLQYLQNPARQTPARPPEYSATLPESTQNPRDFVFYNGRQIEILCRLVPTVARAHLPTINRFWRVISTAKKENGLDNPFGKLFAIRGCKTFENRARDGATIHRGKELL